MTSIFENTKSKVVIHILHDDTLTQDNRHKFIRTAEKYSQGLELHDVTEYVRRLGDKLAKISEQWTIGTLYRMFIPEVLTSLDKVIYLDCDIVVNLDIHELWDVDMEGKSLVGVLDEAAYWVKPFSARYINIRLTGARYQSYINAGVTVMNLRKIRECGNFFDMSYEWLLKHSHLPLYPDQDALNSMFLGDIKFASAKFNVHDMEQNLSDCIMHMYSHKPWSGLLGKKHERIYWKMYLRSAWGENLTREEIIDKLGDTANSVTLTQFLRKLCHKRGIHPDKFLEMRLFRPVTILYRLIKDAYYRMKYKLSH